MLRSHSRLNEPGHVLRLTLERDERGLTLTLSLRRPNMMSTTDLRFAGVQNLRLRGEVTDLGQIVGLIAADISTREWEGIRYSVTDDEEEFVSFVCAEIERL